MKKSLLSLGAAIAHQAPAVSRPLATVRSGGAGGGRVARGQFITDTRSYETDYFCSMEYVPKTILSEICVDVISYL